MTKKVAITIIHGVGTQKADFASEMVKELQTRFTSEIKRYSNKPKEQLIIKPIFWAPVLQSLENKLWQRLNLGGKMSYKKMRKFIVDFAADAIAYQPSPHEKETYDIIHSVFAKTLRITI